MTTLEMLNPAGLLTDRNVRTDLHLTPAFIGSVKANGIIVPIVAIRDPEGIRVRAGHRRTAAAIEAGLTEVPVVVIDTDTDDEATRIVEQIVEEFGVTKAVVRFHEFGMRKVTAHHLGGA